MPVQDPDPASVVHALLPEPAIRENHRAVAAAAMTANDPSATFAAELTEI
jgi:hypothetical protein